MFCSKCGNPLPDNAKFCDKCGLTVTPASVTCGKCGAELPDGAKFCIKCGEKSAAVSAVAVVPEPFGAQSAHKTEPIHAPKPEPVSEREPDSDPKPQREPEAQAESVSAETVTPEIARVKRKTFCTKCGTELIGDAAFCSGCGMPAAANNAPNSGASNISQAVTKSPANTKPLGNKLISTVPYKGNGESASFFDDHVEFGGNSIRYSDVAKMDTRATASMTYAFIFIWGSFNGHIRFTLMNGQMVKIKVYGFSFWGIGSKGSAKRRFQSLFSAAYQIAAKAMAANALAQIRQGATINIAGIEINSSGASCKKLLKRELIYITKQNFGACGLDGYNVRIVDKSGNKLFAASDDSPNALLLPYVLTTLFGN